MPDKYGFISMAEVRQREQVERDAQLRHESRMLRRREEAFEKYHAVVSEILTAYASNAELRPDVTRRHQATAWELLSKSLDEVLWVAVEAGDTGVNPDIRLRVTAKPGGVPIEDNWQPLIKALRDATGLAVEESGPAGRTRQQARTVDVEQPSV